MIPKIAQALSKRLLLRRLRTENKRVKYHSPDPTIDAALEEASWKLNPIGNKLFYESINLACKRQDKMKICEEGVIEVYEKYGEKTYVTDGVSCSCSCFKQLLYCRHIPFVRFKTQRKLFEDACFHSSLTKCNEFNDNSYGEDVGTEVSDYEQPPSPGLELYESQERKKHKSSQAKKYNIAFDATKELAEVLSWQDTASFDSLLKATKNFVKIVRNRMPEDLIQYLENPAKYKITEENCSSTTQVEDNTLQENNGCLDEVSQNYASADIDDQTDDLSLSTLRNLGGIVNSASVIVPTSSSSQSRNDQQLQLTADINENITSVSLPYDPTVYFDGNIDYLFTEIEGNAVFGKLDTTLPRQGCEMRPRQENGGEVLSENFVSETPSTSKSQETLILNDSNVHDDGFLTDEELPDLDYVPLKPASAEPLKFLSIVNKKGRPAVKRNQVRFKSSQNIPFIDESDSFSLTGCEPLQKKARKERSDKGKKRGSYKFSQSVDDIAKKASSCEGNLRSINAPLTRKVMQEQFKGVLKPKMCYTCEFPLIYESQEEDDKVVRCGRCQSFLHSSCVENCRYCEDE